MHKACLIFSLIATVCIPFSLSASEGYIGENPGLDFYSKIDEGNYSVRQKTVTRRLSDTPTLDIFGDECRDSQSVRGAPASAQALDDIANGNYAKLSEVLQTNQARLTTDRFQALTLCLTEKYKTLQARVKDETTARETISYLGLYMDGDTSNSDYDIVSDIDKINMLVFSQKIVYGGTANTTGNALLDFFAKKPIPSLFVTNTNRTNASNTLTGNLSNTTPNPIAPTLGSLLSSTCTASGTTVGPIDTIADEAFLEELSGVISAGNSALQPSGYTAAATLSGAGQASKMTSGDDFFHTLPCTSIFCIKVNMKGGSQNLLGGGKNISIEGLLDKNAAILYPISESALRYEKMTMNASESPIKYLRFVDVIAGLRVYMKEKPQITRRDIREKTPKSEEEELADITRCGNASLGLDTDPARSRSIGGAGYAFTIGTTTESVKNTTLPLGPQAANELERYTDCMEFHMEGSRKSYYDSFSTDITEFQAYTDAMLAQIERIMSTLTTITGKPAH